ncbi:hypothetical protein GCK72_005023 [Caenorhabditis remanei]|uniref:Uncharacterized protein n=1 Tax=Caenorhabditis remanei TaxID=31234 RepID=A0A6A5HFY0_CAERE|nr:hypothetical protein GCK72_005023 [Caenorhabditis remanei]KAF1765072.1 hypothetical protein GCK72_005023 [Caenorhabditis remanei]
MPTEWKEDEETIALADGVQTKDKVLQKKVSFAETSPASSIRIHPDEEPIIIRKHSKLGRIINFLLCRSGSANKKQSKRIPSLSQLFQHAGPKESTLLYSAIFLAILSGILQLAVGVLT